MVQPLQLKRERVGRTKIASNLPFLSVLVDTGVFHLDQPYDYAVPEKLDPKVGEWVSVPFNGRNCSGLILERRSSTNSSGIKPINRIIKGPAITGKLYEFYKAVAKRWACPIFDVLRFAVHYREYSEIIKNEAQGKRNYLQLSVETDEIVQVRNIVEKLAKTGATLLIVPEVRTSELLKSNLYEVGMRGAVLNPKIYSNIVILREESEHHYEIRSPGFNSRDVALLRNEILGENLLFLGFSPSLEMLRLIDNKYVSLKRTSFRSEVSAKPSIQGELIPSAMVKPFKAQLSSGPNLVVVPNKGYGLAISCAACRNVARCECGGRLSKASKNESPYCVICGKVVSQWRCKYCQKDRIYLLGKGINRVAEELGRAFPNVEIHISTADKPLTDPVSKRSLVISTAGAVPNQRFASVLFLEGLLLGSDLRSEERYLSNLFRYTAAANGRAFIVDRPESPFINALIKWNPFAQLERSLIEMRDAKLPPATRHALIRSEEGSRIYTGLQSAIRDGRLPHSCRIHQVENEIISIFFPIKDSAKVLDFLYEYHKRR